MKQPSHKWWAVIFHWLHHLYALTCTLCASLTPHHCTHTHRNPLPDFTSQNWLIIAKRFDNHVVVFISGGTNVSTTAWSSEHLAIINQFGLVKSSNRFNMSTPTHKGFFSSQSSAQSACTKMVNTTTHMYLNTPLPHTMHTSREHLAPAHH